MHILLIAPQPFYQERGTPIAVDLVLRVLSERGDTVDVATYHEGADVNYAGVTLQRIAPPLWVRNVPPGFSIKKLICDVWLFFKVRTVLRRRRPDLIHAVEEAVFFARWWGRRLGLPYVYDMDSSLAGQLVEARPALRGLGRVFQRWEAAVCRDALLVLPVCEALAEIARRADAPRVTLLRDISLLDRWTSAVEPELCRQLPLRGVVFMYVGNLEIYQGLDLLLASWAQAAAVEQPMSLVVVGGTPEHIARYRQRAGGLGVGASVYFIGPRPVNRLAALLRQADVLVSPRVQGHNTPMKIYSYLDAGKPVLATDLPTHTQVLTPEIACLAPPEPAAFAAAIVRLARDPELRQRLGAAARSEARAKYSFAAYRETLLAAYAGLDQSVAARVDQRAALRE
ncbi:MAG: glycosyltransferase family 4 protein [Kiritimatiellaeota bacterium]|nr:glycosyltransferase family 4 protein [Kiritimatiellota bacterium]